MSGSAILVADDSRTVRTQVRCLLTEAGYDVIEASSGKEAVDQLRANPSLLVAVVDINMPEMDGYGVCQTLNEWGTPWSDIPIIFLTSQRSRALELLGEELGAYLRKPICKEQLLEAVEFVSQKETVSDLAP